MKQYLRKIKLMQESSDLCEEKYEDLETKNLNSKIVALKQISAQNWYPFVKHVKASTIPHTIIQRKQRKLKSQQFSEHF